MTADIVRMLLVLKVAVGTTTAGVQALTTLHSSGAHTLADVQAHSDSQTLRAARIANALSGAHPPQQKQNWLQRGSLCRSGRSGRQ